MDEIAILQAEMVKVAKDPQARYASFLKTIQLRLLALNAGESLLLPGGWISGQDGNHAMLYEIAAQDHAHLTFTVFNTGEGVQFHGGVIAGDGCKMRCAGVLRYLDIPMAVLGAQNTPSLWLSALLELSCLPTKHGAYSADDLYTRILPLSGGTPAPADPELAHYFSSQRSGSCSWKVLLAVLRHGLAEKNYKRIKLDIQTQILLTFYMSRPNPNNSELYVIEKGAQNLQRAILKLYREKAIDDRQNMHLQAILAPIGAAVAAHHRKIRGRVAESPGSSMHLTGVKRLPSVGNLGPAHEVAKTRTLPYVPAPPVTPLDLNSCGAYARACQRVGALEMFALHMDDVLRITPVPTSGDVRWGAASVHDLRLIIHHYATAIAIGAGNGDGAQIVSLYTLLAALDCAFHQAVGMPHVRFEWSKRLLFALRRVDILAPRDAAYLEKLWPYFYAPHVKEPHLLPGSEKHRYQDSHLHPERSPHFFEKNLAKTRIEDQCPRP